MSFCSWRVPWEGGDLPWEGGYLPGGGGSAWKGRRADTEIRPNGGRYAAYWNAFLFQIVGLNTNIRFLDSLAGHAEFAAGNVHTGFIEQHYSDLFPQRTLSDPILCKAALALILKEYNSSVEEAFTKSSGKCRIVASFTRIVKITVRSGTFHLLMETLTDRIDGLKRF